jgi:LuxR family maltose regulon positive regulatory protein
MAREVDFLLRHAAGHLRLVLVGRVDPVLPLYRYRLDELMVEVRAADLAFTDEEAGQLLRGLGLRLSDDSVHDLNERLKGWAAGLRFAARALADREDPEQSAATVVAQTGDINEYLLGEVLGVQTPEVRQFLLDTCVTDQLTPELVEELVGPAGLHTLAEVARAGSFIEQVSEQPGSFRYYPFFRDLLRVQLAYEAPRRRAELQRRAAAWYRRHDLVDRSVAHLAAVPAWEEVATELAEPAAVGRMILQGRGALLHDIAGQVPPDLEGQAACVVRAVAALVSGDRGRCQDELVAARRTPSGGRTRDEGVAVSMAVVDALRASLGEDAETADVRAEEAERLVGAPPLPAAAGVEVQALVELGRGVALLRRGDLAAARSTLRVATELGGTLGYAAFRADCLGYLALVDALEGHLSRASRTADESLTAATDAGVPVGERSPAARVALAAVALEQYDLDAAREHVPAATASTKLAEDPVSRAVAEGVVAGLERAAGNVQPALARLDSAAEDLAATDPWLADHLRSEAARLRLASGQAEVALHELESIHDHDSREVAVIAAAAYSAQGMVAAAEGSLARTRGGDLPLRLEVPKLLVEVAEESRQHSSGRARVLLARALRLAAPEEMRRPFREAAPPVQRVLSSDPRLLREHEWLSHVGARVPGQALGSASGRRTSAPEVVETLTAKELEVLEHLEELLTTEEIAEKMFVSVNTVRTHVRSILRKLGVNRRNAAVRKARDLGMLAS